MIIAVGLVLGTVLENTQLLHGIQGTLFSQFGEQVQCLYYNTEFCSSRYSCMYNVFILKMYSLQTWQNINTNQFGLLIANLACELGRLL